MIKHEISFHSTDGLSLYLRYNEGEELFELCMQSETDKFKVSNANASVFFSGKINAQTVLDAATTFKQMFEISTTSYALKV